MLQEERTERIIGAAIEVHRALGPGLLESVYENCLAHELALRGFGVRRQVELPVEYRGVRMECGFRLDLLVDEVVIVEVKAIEKLLPLHEAQLMTYLKLARVRVGLLINFNCLVLAPNIRRRVL